MTQQDARDSPTRTFLGPGDQFPPTVAIPTHPPIRSRHFQRAALASCGHARLSPFPGSARVERLANIHCRSMRIRRVFVAKPCGKPGVSFRMGAVNLLANMHEIRAHAPNFEAYLSQSHGRSRNRPGNPEPSDSLPNRPTPHPKCDWGTADRWQARRPVRARSDAEP